ncbi:hypothetical protein Hanom_Chr09g00863421 [Helianthus anomalus]
MLERKYKVPVFESRISLKAASLFLQGRCKAVYILPSSDPILVLLLVEFTEYDDDDFRLLFHLHPHFFFILIR